MKPHPRIRKTIKWGGAVLTVLLLVVWIGSRWSFVWLNAGNGKSGGLSAGTLWFNYLGPVGAQHPEPFGWGYGAHRGYFKWKSWSARSTWDNRFVLAFWPAPLLTLFITALAWRLDTLARRRERLHLCAMCDYDRTGIAVNAVCPECGAAPAIAQAHAKTATDDTDAHG